MSFSPDKEEMGNNILQYGLSENMRPQKNGTILGAQIQYCYENGELTNKPLWPWPMESRISSALVNSGYNKLGGLNGNGKLSLTKTIFELAGGKIPLDFSEYNLGSPQGLKVR